MKKFFITLAAVVAFAACSDDSATDDPAADDPAVDVPAAWEKLPTEPISGESAKLTVNGSILESGSVQLTATSATQGTLLLTNVLPGYAEITLDVNLSERADGTGTFDITGKAGLTTPPAMIAKAADEPVIFNVLAGGYITPEGKIEVILTSLLSPEAQGGLTGSWDMLKKVTANDEGALLTAPLWVTWSAQDPQKPNGEQTATTVRTIASPLLYQFLHSVTFLPDGTITAEYRKMGENFDFQTEIMNCMFSGFEYDDDYNLVGMADLHPDIPWLDSPKNLLYWYVKGDSLYIVPNIAAILAQIKEDTGSDVSGGLDGITSLLTGLGEYGIDVNALMQLIPQWMETGIPLRYEKSEKGNGLKLYVDKEMCRPVIEALLPALPKLDELIAGLANSEDPMMQMLPGMLYSMLGVEKLEQLKTIWNDNTNEFEVSLNFEN